MAKKEKLKKIESLFRELFECDGRRFGNPPFGLSDGFEGVQWNAWYSQETAWLGVNLEGKKYDGWPIARLVKREISRPLLLTDEYRVRKPECVTVKWTRDAWGAGGSRPPINESRLPPTPIELDRLDGAGWVRALGCAKECLDPELMLAEPLSSLRKYRGRRRTTVTLSHSDRRVELDVTPHLQFKMWFNESEPDAMKRAKRNLEVLHEWATHQARRYEKIKADNGLSAGARS